MKKTGSHARFAPAALAALSGCDWPGNVREPRYFAPLRDDNPPPS
ncbi:hypothetical protein [Burkholderia sp. PU8-34]